MSEHSDSLTLSPSDTVGEQNQPDRFTIRQRLGSGRFGRVFLAWDQRYEREVALKFLRLDSTEHEQLVATHEAKALARIRHPNVVTIHEVLSEARLADGAELPPFLVMEYIDGAELSDIVPKGERIEDLKWCATLMSAVADALGAAHAAKVLHRDVKPSNVMVRNDGAVKLIDFGVARRRRGAVDERNQAASAGSSDAAEYYSGQHPRPDASAKEPPEPQSATAEELGSFAHTDGLVGTPYYMAPELWNGEPASEQTDIFAFGVCFFYLLAGRYPNRVDSLDALERRMSDDQPLPRVRSVRPELPAPLAKIIDRALAWSSSDRYPDVQSLAVDLEPLTGQRLRELPERPYVGLKPFTSHEGGVFFGREAESRRVTDRLRGIRVLTLVGDSGVGKSSLALAGVAPTLERSSLDETSAWRAIRMKPGRDPVYAMAEGLFLHRSGKAPRALGTTWSRAESEEIDKLAAALRNEPETWTGVALKQPTRRRRHAVTSRGLLLVIDQLEELVTVCESRDAQRAFARMITAAFEHDGPLRLLMTVRGDFLSRLAAIPGMVAAMEEVHLVRPLHGEELRTAIVAPAKAFGYDFESEAMVESILSEVMDVGSGLPLLQVSLDRLWDKRDTEKRIIPQAALDELGGVGTALTELAEATYAELEQSGLSGPTNRVLLDLLTPDGTKRSRSLEELERAAEGDDDEPVSDLSAAPSDGPDATSEEESDWDGQTAPSRAMPRETRSVGAHIVERLLHARLLSGDALALELAHDSLVKRWGRLRQLLDLTRIERELIEEAQQVAERWQERDRPKEMLWRGSMLSSAKHVLAYGGAYGTFLTPDGKAFVQASIRHDTRNRRLRLGIGAAVLVLLTSVLAFAAGTAQERNRAKDEAWTAKKKLKQEKVVTDHFAKKLRKVKIEFGNSKIQYLKSAEAYEKDAKTFSELYKDLWSKYSNLYKRTSSFFGHYRKQTRCSLKGGDVLALLLDIKDFNTDFRKTLQ